MVEQCAGNRGHAVDMALGAGIPRTGSCSWILQGACLSLEYLATRAVSSLRHGASGRCDGHGGRSDRRSAVPRVATVAQRDALHATPVILACGDADPHIPEALVRESAAYLAALGARTDLRIYPGVGHDIVGDEIDALRLLVEEVRGRIVDT